MPQGQAAGAPRIRAVYEWQHPLAGLTALALMEFGDSAMLRRMLRGIKARAEAGQLSLRLGTLTPCLPAIRP